MRKVTFTGSVEVGRIIAKGAAEKMVPVTLELGGKSPMIVFADCDFDKTVMGAVTSMRFTRQGQSCTAASRIYVERPIFQRFVDAVAAKVDAMVMGDPLDEKTDIGTIISTEQLDKVKAFIDEGLATAGGTGRACSAMPDDPALAKGLFIRPYIFTDLPNESRLVQEEIFGPCDGHVPVRRRRGGAGGCQRDGIRPGGFVVDQQSNPSGWIWRIGSRPGWCRSIRTSWCRPIFRTAA